MSGHHNDRYRQLALRYPFLEQSHAIGIRHPDIEQYKVWRAAQPAVARLARVRGDFDNMPLIMQNFREQLTNPNFIIRPEWLPYPSSTLYAALRHQLTEKTK